MVREYKGSHSGEHGDGLVRSEFHEAMFGQRWCARSKRSRTASTRRPVQSRQDRAARALRRSIAVSLRRATRRSACRPRSTGPSGAASTAPSRCATTTAPAARPARRHVPVLPRHAGREARHPRARQHAAPRLTGQLGPDALTSDELYETMDLCVGCKGCKRECPTGVDMARMKTEFLYHYRKRHGLRLRDRLVAYLPRYAPLASALAPVTESARPGTGTGAAERARARAQREAFAAPLATRSFRRSDARARSSNTRPARSRCWSTPSTDGSNPRTHARLKPCSRPRVTRSCTRSPPTPRNLCAADAPSSLQVWLTRHARS